VHQYIQANLTPKDAAIFSYWRIPEDSLWETYFPGQAETITFTKWFVWMRKENKQYRKCWYTPLSLVWWKKKKKKKKKIKI